MAEAELIELGAHDNMCPVETLDYCHRRRADYEEVIVIGFDETGDLMLNCSHMSRERANWILDAAKMHVFTNPMLELEKDRA